MPKKHTYKIELRETRKGATDSALSRFERNSGVKIPLDYRMFLLCQNGGAPKKRNFTFGKDLYQDSILRFFLGVDCPLDYNLKLALDKYKGRIPLDTFPIAIDEFDNLIIISTNPSAIGQVLFWDHEKEFTKHRPIRIASSLEVFLGMLEVDKVVVFDIATIVFDNGETCRRVLPSRFFSRDQNKVIDVTEATDGECIEEFGDVKTIVSIKYSREPQIT